MIQNNASGVANLINLATAATSGQQSTRRPISQSKSLSGLKVLASDKAEFKAWNEKIINAMAQTRGNTLEKVHEETKRTPRSEQKGAFKC